MCRASSPPSPSATAWFRAGRARARSGATPGRAPWRRAARARAVSLLPRHGRRNGLLGDERRLLVEGGVLLEQLPALDPGEELLGRLPHDVVARFGDPVLRERPVRDRLHE